MGKTKRLKRQAIGRNRSILRQRIEARAEPTKAAMKRYNPLQLTGLFLAGLILSPFLLIKNAFGGKR